MKFAAAAVLTLVLGWLIAVLVGLPILVERYGAVL